MFQRETKRTRKRRLLTTLSLTALAGLLLGAAQVSAAHPVRGHERGDCLRALVGGLKLDNALDELVEDGAITAEQEEAILEHLGERRLDRTFGCNGVSILRQGAIGDAVTDLLGLERFEIRRAWLDGQSLVEIAEAQGVDRASLVDTILTALTDRLDVAVDDGKITVEQRDRILTNASPVIERAVDLHRGELREEMAPERSDVGSPATPASTNSDVVTA